MNTNYAALLMDAHRYPEALAQFNKALERDPNFGPAHLKLAQLYAVTGDFANAVNELHKFTLTPGSWSPDATGYRDLALVAFDKPDENTWAAMALSATGDRNKAFEHLQKALADQEIELVLCIRYPTFDPIRSDRRYADMMQRLGLPE